MSEKEEEIYKVYEKLSDLIQFYFIFGDKNYYSEYTQLFEEHLLIREDSELSPRVFKRMTELSDSEGDVGLLKIIHSAWSRNRSDYQREVQVINSWLRDCTKLK